MAEYKISVGNELLPGLLSEGNGKSSVRHRPSSEFASGSRRQHLAILERRREPHRGAGLEGNGPAVVRHLHKAALAAVEIEVELARRAEIEHLPDGAPERQSGIRFFAGESRALRPYRNLHHRAVRGAD